MNMIKALGCAIGVLMTTMAVAQIPVNKEKQYEYTGTTEVKRVSTGELQKRFIYWAKDYYAKTNYSIEVDDTTKRWVTIDATIALPESHFGVNRTHKDRQLSYTLKVDAYKKTYTYWINNLRYKATEIDRKGVEIPLSGKFEDIKTPAKMSVEEEIHNALQGVIVSFSKAVELPLPEGALKEMEPVAEPSEAAPDSTSVPEGETPATENPQTPSSDEDISE